jgi:hypothetical protein
MQEIKTLLDAVKYFSNLDACFEYMLGIKAKLAKQNKKRGSR